MKWLAVVAGVGVASAAGALEPASPPAPEAPSPAAPALPRYALSLELPALLSTGLEVDGERFFADRRWSAVVALGGAWSFGAGDYTSQTYNVGGELRFWLNALRLPFMKRQGGPFAAVRADLAVNRMLDHRTGQAFVTLEAEGIGSLGYRLVFFDCLELTHWVGGSLTSSLTTQPRVVWGVPLWGWVFDVTLGYLF